MISGKALLKKTFNGSKYVVTADMEVHLHLPDNTSKVVGFRLVLGRRAFKCQAPNDKTD
jgi:hypothetical protein